LTDEGDKPDRILSAEKGKGRIIRGNRAIGRQTKRYVIVPRNARGPSDDRGSEKIDPRFEKIVASLAPKK